MFIVRVSIHVKPGCVSGFKAATLSNVQNSIQEEGIARFDFAEQLDDPNRFAPVEVYRQPGDAAKHKKTTHYLVWRDTVEHMMAEPRSGIKFSNIAPDDMDW